MVDRGANIDIVFRNGLKDFEVMPPPEVWENIQPSLKVKPTTIPHTKECSYHCSSDDNGCSCLPLEQ